jgi:hypothetical protein
MADSITYCHRRTTKRARKQHKTLHIIKDSEVDRRKERTHSQQQISNITKQHDTTNKQEPIELPITKTSSMKMLA